MSPAECWDLIRHLPSDSALMAALAADEEFAGDDGEESPEPRWEDFSPEARVLADVYDMLAVLVRQVAAIGGEPPKIAPYPRPGDARRAAAEEERRALARVEWADLCRQLGVELEKYPRDGGNRPGAWAT